MQLFSEVRMSLCREGRSELGPGGPGPGEGLKYQPSLFCEVHLGLRVGVEGFRALSWSALLRTSPSLSLSSSVLFFFPPPLSISFLSLLFPFLLISPRFHVNFLSLPYILLVFVYCR